MNSNEESHEQLIILVGAIFGLISCIMSILATTTSGWQIDSYFNKTGLFQTCYKDFCTTIQEKHDLSIGFSIIGQCLMAFGVIASFSNTFIYRRRLGTIMVTIFFFLSCLLFWITILTISSYLYLNGGSAIIFNAAIAFSLLATFTASYASGAAFAIYNNVIPARTITRFHPTAMAIELSQYPFQSFEMKNSE